MHCTWFFLFTQSADNTILGPYVNSNIMDFIHEHESLGAHPEVSKKVKSTLGERAADGMTNFLGSWAFIFGFLFFLFAWIIINIFAWWMRWDPFPFILLNLTLSSIAALQGPIIMMSQNRQAIRDRLQAKYDYTIDRKAEREIGQIQIELKEIKAKLDTLLSKNL